MFGNYHNIRKLVFQNSRRCIWKLMNTCSRGLYLETSEDMGSEPHLSMPGLISVLSGGLCPCQPVREELSVSSSLALGHPEFPSMPLNWPLPAWHCRWAWGRAQNSSPPRELESNQSHVSTPTNSHAESTPQKQRHRPNDTLLETNAPSYNALCLLQSRQPKGRGVVSSTSFGIVCHRSPTKQKGDWTA